MIASRKNGLLVQHQMALPMTELDRSEIDRRKQKHGARQPDLVIVGVGELQGEFGRLYIKCTYARLPPLQQILSPVQPHLAGLNPTQQEDSFDHLM